MTKRELLHFSFHDHTGITRHLEEMAQKGWMLEKAGFFWTYRQEEPRAVRYAVTYFPNGAEGSDPPGEKESLFRDLCESAGWEYVTRYREMQIFRSFRTNPVPLDTEPMVQVETIHKSMKNVRLNHLAWGLVYPLILGFSLYLTGDVIGYLPLPCLQSLSALVPGLHRLPMYQSLGADLLLPLAQTGQGRRQRGAIPAHLRPPLASRAGRLRHFAPSGVPGLGSCPLLCSPWGGLPRQQIRLGPYPLFHLR